MGLKYYGEVQNIMGVKSNISLFVLLILVVVTAEIFPQDVFPFKNKYWQWLTPEDNKIYSLAVEGDTVWAGSDIGFFKLNIETGERINYNRINSSLPDNWILSIVADSNHCKWIGTSEKGVVKIDGNNWQVFGSRYFGLYGMNIRDMELEKDYLWIATWGDGIIKMNTRDNTYRLFTEANSGLLYDAITDIEIDSEGTKWFATMLGLCKYDGNSWMKVNSSGDDFKSMINSISMDANGNLWALFENSMIAKYDGSYWEKYKIPDSLFRCGFTDLSSIYVDEMDNIWIGTFDGPVKFYKGSWTLIGKKNCGYDLGITECIQPGINGDIWVGSWNGLFSLHNSKAKIYHTGNTDLPGRMIYSIQTDRKNKVWVGTDKGLASFYKGEWDVFTKFNSELPGNLVKHIAVDQMNNKWISIMRDGLVKFYDINNTWQVYDTLNSSLPDNFIYDLAVDKDGLIWLGTRKGLACFDGVNWKNYNQENSGLPFQGVRQIAFDEQNNLWLISSKLDLKDRGDKIVKFDGKNFMEIDPPEGFNKLKKVSVYGFSIDKNNVKWIATSDNLVWLDDKEWKFADRNLLQVLFSCLGDIYCEDNMKWICSTMGGLIRYNGSKFMVWNNENSYLPNNIFTVSKDNFGNIWIGTQDKGIIIYNPEGITYE